MLFSIWLAQRDGKRLEVERREASEDRAEFRRLQAEEAEQRKRRLASQVTLYSESGYDSEGKQVSRTYHIHNGGDEPISKVRILERPIVDDALSPRLIGMARWPIIEAGGRREKELTFPYLVRPEDRSLVFQDGLGQSWRKNELGALRRLEKSDPELQMPLIHDH